MMNLFDTFMDDFCDEKYMQGISDLDERAQLEVSMHFISQNFYILLPWRPGFSYIPDQLAYS
jgi:hypothetical protein